MKSPDYEKLVSMNGMCSLHPAKHAEYLCETCCSLFCVSCYYQHVKTMGSHIVYNYKECAASFLEKLMTHPMLDLQPDVSIAEEPKLHQTMSKVYKSVDEFKVELAALAKNFQQAYINGPKEIWAKETSISTEVFQNEINRMKEMEEKGEYLQLYLHSNKLLNSVKSTKQKMEIPFHLLKESLVKKAERFFQEIADICQELAPPPAYPVPKEQKEILQEESPLPEPLPSYDSTSSVNEEIKREEIKIGPKPAPTTYFPLFAEYEKDLIGYFHAEDEEELLQELSKVDMGQYKMLSIDCAFGASDKTAQYLSAILPACPNITAFYLCTIYASKDRGRECIR